MPHQVRAGRWACSGATPAQFLPSVFSSLTLKENERVSKNSMAEGVSGILTTIKNLILRPHPHTLVDRVEKIHRNSTTLRVHEQSTLLTGLPEDPEVRDLISKPTLAGL
jgi:hypothetical protein